MGRSCNVLYIMCLMAIQVTSSKSILTEKSEQEPSTTKSAPAPIFGPWACINGQWVTQKPKTEFDIRIHCECIEGWTGDSCDIQCDLKCKHGKCIHENEITRAILCDCFDTHTGVLCEAERCLRKCTNGNCTFDEDGSQICVCKEGFTGPSCDGIKPMKRPAAFWAAVGTTVGLFVILLVMTVLMPYIMWKKRALIILKIHYYFQKYEDDDSCRFDAFISYGKAEEDARFVVNTLVPMLERSMGFDVCFADRNFVYGEAHIDNITAAVKQSRRTILVVTPRYLADEWPVFEALTAQMQSLSSAHKLIPIIFRDVKVDHPTLRNILASLRAITYPHEGTEKEINKFYKRLLYGMPKLKSKVAIDTEPTAT